ASFSISLPPGQARTLYLTTACAMDRGTNRLLPFDQAHTLATNAFRQAQTDACTIQTSSEPFNDWVNRATADLYMMTTQTPTGLYPYAGIPWFSTPFGRDGLLTAFECLWAEPTLAHGVLAYLAATQATELIPEQDAEPGKILHETRDGEMAALKEIPFGRYYGSVDATPLFVILAGAYFERTADRSYIESSWPNVEAALLWMGRYGDRDRDGFIEYQRRCADGLIHQGWKDSDDAICHADGSLARGPIAVCEVQGYAYAARRAGAVLAAALGRA